MRSEWESMNGRSRLSEDEAHRLLARAAELDAKDGAEVSVAELREAAREAGITPAAFAKALEELETGILRPETVGHRIAAWLSSYRRVACALGFVSAAAVTPGDTIVLTIALGLGWIGAYEGAIVLARLLGGQAPPRVPPESQAATKSDRRAAADQQDPQLGTSFALLAWIRAGVPCLHPVAT